MKTFTKLSLDKFLRSLRSNEENFNDAEAYDIAECILLDTDGLKEAIIKFYKVTDVTGFLADKVC